MNNYKLIKVKVSDFTDNTDKIHYVKNCEDTSTDTLYFKKITVKTLNDAKRNSILSYFKKISIALRKKEEEDQKELMFHYDEILKAQEKFKEQIDKIREQKQIEQTEEEKEAEQVAMYLKDSKSILKLGIDPKDIIAFGEEFRKEFIFVDEECTVPFNDNGITEQLDFDEVGVYSFLLTISIPKSFL